VATGFVAAIGVLGTTLVGAPAALAASETVIHVDGASGGRIYDGVGAVSGGGATTRLLLDYPEAEREEVLDYLFLPGYGAALEMLKVEIGGDTNSTDGSESSHMHEADVVNCNAGYEWWLMKEATERNPDINLGGLAWGAPGWLGDAGGYYSEATIDYFITWLDCASEHGLTIDNMGVRNERDYDIDWIIDFRAALDAAGYESVRIVASDEAAVKGEWPIAVDMANDPALYDAVGVLGNHYSQGPSSPTAQALDKPLWISEGGPWSAEWGAGGPPKAVPSLINNAYLRGQITAVQFWNLLTAYYDGLSISDAGLMRSNTPWSGDYQVQSAIWTVAHTTQFVEPGWQHLDSSSAFFVDGDPQQGSYVTRRAPDSGDWSTVIERIGTTEPRTVTFDVAEGLVAGDLHVWQSTEDQQFVQQPDLVPAVDGTYELTVPADSVVTVTTTTGQGKGDAVGQNPSAFPFPYTNDLSDGGPSGQTPYFSQMEGAYEIRDCEGDREGTCLEQVSPQRAISWAAWKQPAGIIGDPNWSDYRVSVDAWVPEDGTAQVLGRVTNDAMQPVPNGYGVSLSADGTWSIGRGELGGKEWVELASGSAGASAGGAWHRLSIAFDEERIIAEVDGVEVGSVTDSTWVSGMAGLSGDYSAVQFADLAIEPLAPMVQVSDASDAVTGEGAGWQRCGDATRACGGLTPGAIAAADGTVSASRTAGDVLTFDFEGTQATLNGLTGPRGGTAEVSVDGNAPVSLSFTAQGANGELVWRSPVLTDGAHSLRVEVTSQEAGDRGWVAIDGIEVAPPNGGPSSIDDQTEGVGLGRFDYQGDGWLSCPGCINRTQLFHSSVTSSGTPGDTATLRFVGTSLDLYGLRASNQGTAEVRIDGELVGEANFRGNPRLGNQLIWESADLAEGEHTLTLTAVEGGGTINIDRVVVHP
jgi:O-glycosyl hydrolase